MAKDWYRQTTWDSATQEEFSRRLKRARDKGQYLQIQSGTLLSTWEGTGDRNLLEAALQLAETALRDHPGTLLATSLDLRARCLMALGREEEAVAAYRAVIAREKAHPFLRTGGPLDFVVYVATANRAEMFEEALGLLSEIRKEMETGGTSFPVHRFRAAAALAIILHNLGRRAEASKVCAEALDAAAQTHSGFRYHPTLGLVGEKSKPLLEHVKTLAAELL